MSDDVHPAAQASSPGESESGLKIRLFGPMEVHIGSRRLPRLSTRKGLWLLALLALRAGRDVERSWLAGTLWPDVSEAQSRRSLRQSLHDLRVGLGPEARRLTGEPPRMLRLELSDSFVDVLAFDAAIECGNLDSLEAAVRLYRGPLLAECVEEWVVEERQRREQAYVAALERLATAAAARGEYEAPASYLRLAVGVDPYREELQRALMETLAEGGSPSAALVVYRQFRALLWREMTAQPAEETTALFRRLREQTRTRAQPRTSELSGAASSPGIASRPSPAHRSKGNLPRPLSAFVGRDRELLEVDACLSDARLVTLTGTGGIGKTRLAIRIAEECAEEYADGAWFVDLAALTDPALVPQAVARALRLPESPECPLIQTLQDTLGAQRLLLVLDNCEHLLDACARLAATLLSACPHLRILATSRQALGLTGEISWSIAPLPLPPVADDPGSVADRPTVPAGSRRSTNLPLSTISQYEAVRLFVERAGNTVPDFTLTESNSRATVQVCRRLDGIPLAIELAAARLKALSVEQIAARLDDRFRLLTGGSRDALPRQQTLRATIDWSHDLLSEPERILLRRLSVFTGGFTLEAAEAVCADFRFSIFDFGLERRPISSPQPEIENPKSEIRNCDVLDLLTQLVDRSLVGVERREGVARYGLLETTGEYARERLQDAGERDEWRARHAWFFLTLAERAWPELKGPAQAQWLRRLEEEHDNFRAAIEYFVVRGAVEEGLRLGGALGWFWWLRGYFSEGRERLRALLSPSGCAMGGPGTGTGFRITQSAASARGPEQRPPGLRLAQAKALLAAGMLADEQSDYEEARALFEESLALSRELADAPGVAAVLNTLGGQALRARDFPAARALYEESLAVSRGIGDHWSAAASLTSLGRVAMAEGEYTAARSLVESGLEMQRQLQDRRVVARSLATLGNIAWKLGELSSARALYEESLLLARELGARGVIEETLNVLGTVARALGDRDAALAYHEERLTIARELGDKSGIAEGLIDQALLARDRGDRAQARALWLQSLSILRRLGDQGFMVADCLDGLASLAAPPDPMKSGPSDEERGGQRTADNGSDGARQAARLFGAAATLRERVGAPVLPWDREEYERRVAAVRAVLDEAAFAAAWEEGRTMALEQAIRVALGEDE